MRSEYQTSTVIRVGDTVAILSGKDAGKRGTVERLVNPGRVVVTGVNISKKHQKPRQKMSSGSQTPTVDKGGILEIAAHLIWRRLPSSAQSATDRCASRWR